MAGEYDTTYGVDPAIASYVQAGGMPAPAGYDPSLGAPADVAAVPQVEAPVGGIVDPYALHPAVAQAVQNGFAPPVVQPIAAAPPVVPTAPPPETTKQIATPSEAQVDTANKAIGQHQAQAAAYAQSAEGLQQQANQQQRAAIEEKRQANEQQAAAEQDANTAALNVQTKTQQRADDQAKIDAQQNAEDHANVQKYTQQYADQIKAAADYKVDTNRDIGARGLIAIALSGIGDALDHVHGPNAALGIINASIDKKIQDQWAQKDALGKKADQTRSVLDQYRKGADDDRQAQSIQRGAMLEDAKRQLDMAALQSANPQVKARAKLASAGIDAELANITGAEAARKAAALRQAQEDKVKQQEIGIQYGHLKLAQQNAADEREFKKAQIAAEVLKAQGAGDEARAKQLQKVKDEGLFDPTTANVIVDQSAAPILAKAKQLDAQAAASSDPKQQEALQQQANSLRAAAQENHAITGLGKEANEKLVGAQSLVNVTQRIRDELDSGGLLDRTTRAKLKTDAVNAFTAWAELNGVKASSREHQVYEEAVGALDGYSATNIKKSALKASLDSLDTQARDKVDIIIRSKGHKPVDENGNPWSLHAPSGLSTPALTGTTSVEAAQRAEPGLVTKVTGVDFAHPFTSPGERDPVNVENAGEITPTGLTKEDDAAVSGLMSQYGKRSVDDNKRIVSSLANYARGLVDGTERDQSIANAVLGRLKEDRRLYDDVVSKLPKDAQDIIKQRDDVGPLPYGLPGSVTNYVQGKK